MIKVGDRIVIRSWPQIKTVVKRIYKADSVGKETRWEFETGLIILELDSGEFGISKVSLHDENKYWYRYSDAN